MTSRGDARRSAAQWRGATIGAAVVVAAAGLAACREHARLETETAAIASDPAKRHPIAFTTRVEALYVEIPDSGDGLSPNQRADVARFLGRYKAENTGPLRIAAPTGARGHLAVARAMRDVAEIVDEVGIPREALLTARSGGSRMGLAVKLAYERAVAVPPPCALWPADLGDASGAPYADFGCSSQRNLALTVANARDLQYPQEETPRSSERRSANWTKYVGGSGKEEGASSSSAATGGTKPGEAGAKK
jgi:pilus assembly protein CpaD